MHPRLRKSAALFSVVAVLGGGGIAATQATGATGTTTAATAAMPPRGGLTTTQLERIAAKLGVSAAQLKAAVEANRPARRDDAQRPPAGAGPAADLAEALGVDEAKVRKILDGEPARRGHP